MGGHSLEMEMEGVVGSEIQIQDSGGRAIHGGGYGDRGRVFCVEGAGEEVLKEEVC